jgi:hypothetical protein
MTSTIRHDDDLNYCCIVFQDCCADRNAKVHSFLDSAQLGKRKDLLYTFYMDFPYYNTINLILSSLHIYYPSGYQ